MSTCESSPKTSSLDESSVTTSSDQVSNSKVGRSIYDRHEMLEIYMSPLSKIRPEYLSEEFDEIAAQNEQGVRKLWKPDLWIQNLWAAEKPHASSSAASTATNSGSVSTSANSNTGSMATNFRPPRYVHNSQRMNTDAATSHKRGFKSSDPAKDNGGIVLVPQRRSFVGGCHAPATTNAADVTLKASPTSAAAVVGVDEEVTSTAPIQPPAVTAAAPRQRQTSFGDSTAPSSQQRRGAGAGGGGGGFYNKSGGNENWREKNLRNALEYDSRRRWTGGGSNAASSAGERSAPSGNGGCGSASSHCNSTNDHHGHYQPHSFYSNPQQRPQYNRSSPSAYYRSNGRDAGGTDFSSRDLPEWATDGPLDVHDTIELHGFDDDASAAIDGENWLDASNDDWRGAKRAADSVTDRVLSETSEPLKNREPFENRGSLQNRQQRNEKVVDRENDEKQNGLINIEKSSNETVPTGSRFSKFFAGSTNRSNSSSKEQAVEKLPNFTKENQKVCEKSIPEKRISASVLLADSSNLQNVHPDLQARNNANAMTVQGFVDPSNKKIPAGAMNLEDLEAILCQKSNSVAGVEKNLHNGAGSVATLTPNPSCADLPGKKRGFLQELFRSVDIVPKFSQGTPSTSTSNDVPPSVSDGLSMPVHLSNLTNLPPRQPMQKGDPLSDPGQQQQLFDALNKLHNQQQTNVQANDHRLASNLPLTSSSTNASTQQMAGGLSNLVNQMAPNAPFSLPTHLPLLLPHQQLALHAALLQQHNAQTSGAGASKLSPVSFHTSSQDALLAATLSAPPGQFFAPPGTAAGSMGQQPSHDLLLNTTHLAYQKALINKKFLEEQQQQLLQMQAKQLSNAGQQQQTCGDSGSGGDYANSTTGKPVSVSAFTPTSVLKQMRCGTPSKNLGGASVHVKSANSSESTSTSSAPSTLSSISPPRAKAGGFGVAGGAQALAGQSATGQQAPGVTVHAHGVVGQSQQPLFAPPMFNQSASGLQAPFGLATSGPQAFATSTSGGQQPQAMLAGPSSSLPPAEMLRLLAQQQQQRQQQLARAQQHQQWQLLQQQIGAAGMLPRLMAPNVKQFSGDEYQQMLSMALLQQQQQQQIRAAGNATFDMLKQRAMLAATLQQQQAAHLLNSMRQPNLAVQQELNLRHLMGFSGGPAPGGGQPVGGFPPMPTATPGSKPMTVDDLERAHKAAVASSSANQ